MVNAGGEGATLMVANMACDQVSVVALTATAGKPGPHSAGLSATG
jgi:hypothetical protein